MSAISRMVGSKTPCVDGYVIISAARREACCSALARRSPRSTSPASSTFTATTSMPAMTAEAGFVPCADVGIRHTVRASSPRERWYARIVSRPVYSPIAPELGWRLTAWKPVMSAIQSLSSPIMRS